MWFVSCFVVRPSPFAIGCEWVVDVVHNECTSPSVSLCFEEFQRIEEKTLKKGYLSMNYRELSRKKDILIYCCVSSRKKKQQCTSNATAAISRISYSWMHYHKELHATSITYIHICVYIPRLLAPFIGIYVSAACLSESTSVGRRVIIIVIIIHHPCHRYQSCASYSDGSCLSFSCVHEDLFLFLSGFALYALSTSALVGKLGMAPCCWTHNEAAVPARDKEFTRW